MCFCMIFMVLALNVVMFSVVPDYTTYGSQSYLVNSTSGEMVTKRCDDVERRIVECNMSRYETELNSTEIRRYRRLREQMDTKIEGFDG